jgi:predicted transcriptional regulator
MTTSFQIPDALIQKTEQLAQARGLSRDEIVVDALAQYLGSDEVRNGVTARLNAVYATESSTLEPGLALIQSSSLPKESW